MLSVFTQYRKVEKHITNLVFAELFIQIINAGLLLILLIYMQKSGYTDYESADFISYRFLGTLAFALPLGYFIKGRAIKPLFLIGSITIPICSLLIIYAIDNHLSWLLYLSQFLWGVFFLCFQITPLPFILRTSKQSNHTEAITLSFATYSFGGILSGALIFTLKALSPEIFNEKNILIFLSFLSFLSYFFIRKIKLNEKESFINENKEVQSIKNFDWNIIIKALIPVLIIATGAGLSIPFIGIFFYNVHQIDSHQYAIIGSIAALLVAFAAILVPQIKSKLGYQKAVPITQSIAVIALILMATTEWFKEFQFAAFVAIACYLVRQPLMNIATPMTSEVVMNYVGSKNREIASALNSAIWSGSWFISSRVFKELRELGLAYVMVFLITALLYGIGVFSYYLLIKDYNKKVLSGIIDD
jgi:hypothetical protein